MFLLRVSRGVSNSFTAATSQPEDARTCRSAHGQKTSLATTNRPTAACFGSITSWMADALLVHDWLPLSDYAPFSPSADLTKRPITGPVIRFNFQPNKKIRSNFHLFRQPLSSTIEMTLAPDNSIAFLTENVAKRKKRGRNFLSYFSSRPSCQKRPSS